MSGIVIVMFMTLDHKAGMLYRKLFMWLFSNAVTTA
jgi:hypothetical protein